MNYRFLVRQETTSGDLGHAAEVRRCGHVGRVRRRRANWPRVISAAVGRRRDGRHVAADDSDGALYPGYAAVRRTLVYLKRRLSWNRLGRSLCEGLRSPTQKIVPGGRPQIERPSAPRDAAAQRDRGRPGIVSPNSRQSRARPRAAASSHSQGRDGSTMPDSRRHVDWHRRGQGVAGRGLDHGDAAASPARPPMIAAGLAFADRAVAARQRGARRRRSDGRLRARAGDGAGRSRLSRGRGQSAAGARLRQGLGHSGQDRSHRRRWSWRSFGQQVEPRLLGRRSARSGPS